MGDNLKLWRAFHIGGTYKNHYGQLLQNNYLKETFKRCTFATEAGSRVYAQHSQSYSSSLVSLLVSPGTVYTNLKAVFTNLKL